MSTQPGYLSNSELAIRISALVDRWNTRENQMILMLTQENGTVVVTDGVGVDHELPSFPQLQKNVDALTDSLTGAVVDAQSHAEFASLMASASERSASDSMVYSGMASTQAELAGTHAASAADSAAASGDSASASDASAAAASASASSAASSVVTAQGHSDASETYASNSAISASESSTQANLATQARVGAEDARDMASAWADSPRGTEVAPGRYSAQHWAQEAKDSATGALVYKGTWDASTGAYPSPAENGHLYRVSVAGTVEGVVYIVGDQVIYDGTGWDKIDGGGKVTSVAGRVGDVALQATDVAGLGGLATKEQAAWDTDISGKPVSFPPAAHSHSWGTITGKPATFPADAHSHHWDTVQGRPAAYPPSIHYHTIGDIENLHAALGAKAQRGANASFRDVQVTRGDTSGAIFFGEGENAYLYKRSGESFEFSFAPGKYTYLDQVGTIYTTAHFNHALKADLGGATFTGAVVSPRVVGGPESGSHTTLQSGGPHYSGYISFTSPDGTRAGYMGNADGRSLMFMPEGGREALIGATTRITGPAIADRFYSSDGAVGPKYSVGDDADLWDVGIANTIGVRGLQDASVGYAQFGTSPHGFGWNGSYLNFGPHVMWHSGNISPIDSRSNAELASINGAWSGQGFQLMWNTVEPGTGRTELINNRGSGSGGFSLYDRTSPGHGVKEVMRLDTSGALHLKAHQQPDLIRVPRFFVQPGDPGAWCEDGDFWVW